MSFENNAGRKSYIRYYLPLAEIKDDNVTINGQNVFDQLVKTDLITYDNIINIATGHGGDYATVCLLDYPYFKNHYKMITIDLSKQQAFDADSEGIYEISFTANLDWDGSTKMFFITEGMRETISDFSHGTSKVL